MRGESRAASGLKPLSGKRSAWEGLGGLTRESVEQDASVPKKGKSFERDATVPVFSEDGTVCQRARCNFFTELQLFQRT